jgi:hypothetical protein
MYLACDVYLFLYEAKSVFFSVGCDGHIMFKLSMEMLPNEEVVRGVLIAVLLLLGCLNAWWMYYYLVLVGDGEHINFF